MTTVSVDEFNKLLVKWQPYIIGQVKRRGGGDNTDDIVQEVMLQACRVRRNFDPDKGGFATWVWWQIRSCMQTLRIKAHKRQPLNHTMLFHDDGEPVDEVAVLGNQHERVELRETLDAIDELDPRTGDIVLQRAVGATLEEVSDRYGISKQRVEQIQGRGLDRLRKKLNRVPVGVGAQQWA